MRPIRFVDASDPSPSPTIFEGWYHSTNPAGINVIVDLFTLRWMHTLIYERNPADAVAWLEHLLVVQHPTWPDEAAVLIRDCAYAERSA